MERGHGAVSVDWGQSGTTAALWWQKRDEAGGWHVADEYYVKGGGVSDSAHLEAMVGKWGMAQGYVFDPSAVSMKLEAHKMGLPSISAPHPINAVARGIGAVLDRLQSGKLTIDTRCRHLLDEAAAYCYNPKTKQPVKSFDHACDALRYGVMVYMPKGTETLVGG